MIKKPQAHAFFALLLAAAPLASPSRAVAQGVCPATLPPDAKTACERYNHGRTLVERQGACGGRQNKSAPSELSTEALADFLRADELVPKPISKFYAAGCHQHLGHFGEALALYTRFINDMRDPKHKASLDPAKNEALAAVEKLRLMIGNILIETSPGAQILVDDRPRGEYPAERVLDVPPGPRTVVVFMQGFESVTEMVTVDIGETKRVVAKLRPLVHPGRLTVREKSDKVVDVILDGTKVGKTPWVDRLVPAGPHTVVLVGDKGLGTQPVKLDVSRGELKEYTAEVVQLAGQLEVVPTPSEANVFLDGVFVGRGIYRGNLPPKKYKIRVIAEGFFAAPEKEVELRAGAPVVLQFPLKRDETSSVWRKPGRFTLEAGGGAPISPSFGGDVAGACTGACSAALAIGGLATFKGGYELGNGLGVGATAGYLAMMQSTTGRSTSLQPVGFRTPDSATVNDTVGLRGFLAGAWAGYSHYTMNERVRLHARVGLGGLFGVVADERSGTFNAQNTAVFLQTPGKATPFSPLTSSASTSWLYVAPEVRVGLRLANHLEASVGVEAMTLFAVGAPVWDSTAPVNAAVDGLATFKGDAITSSVLFAVSPGLGLRYDF